jgi:Nitrous oxide reductase
MSRTPLFRLIRRSLRLAQVSLRTGRPVDEVVDRWRGTPKTPRMSRRDFLGTTALAAAGLALGCRAKEAGPAAPGTRSAKGAGREVLDHRRRHRRARPPATA